MRKLNLEKMEGITGGANCFVVGLALWGTIIAIATPYGQAGLYAISGEVERCWQS